MKKLIITITLLLTVAASQAALAGPPEPAKRPAQRYIICGKLRYLSHGVFQCVGCAPNICFVVNSGTSAQTKQITAYVAGTTEEDEDPQVEFIWKVDEYEKITNADEITKQYEYNVLEVVQ